MFDAHAEYGKLLENADVLLAKARERIAASKSASAKPTDETEKLSSSVAELETETNAVTADLHQLIADRNAKRAEKVAQAKFITKAALRLFAVGAVA